MCVLCTCVCRMRVVWLLLVIADFVVSSASGAKPDSPITFGDPRDPTKKPVSLAEPMLDDPRRRTPSVDEWMRVADLSGMMEKDNDVTPQQPTRGDRNLPQLPSRGAKNTGGFERKRWHDATEHILSGITLPDNNVYKSLERIRASAEGKTIERRPDATHHILSGLPVPNDQFKSPEELSGGLLSNEIYLEEYAEQLSRPNALLGFDDPSLNEWPNPSGDEGDLPSAQKKLKVDPKPTAVWPLHKRLKKLDSSLPVSDSRLLESPRNEQLEDETITDKSSSTK